MPSGNSKQAFVAPFASSTKLRMKEAEAAFDALSETVACLTPPSEEPVCLSPYNPTPQRNLIPNLKSPR
jgi:hypothetical protein